MSCGIVPCELWGQFKVRERNGRNRHWEAKRFRLGKTEETVSSMSIGKSNSNTEGKSRKVQRHKEIKRY